MTQSVLYRVNLLWEKTRYFEKNIANIPVNATINPVIDPYFDEAKSVARDEDGKSRKEVINSVCSSVMNNYDKIFDAINLLSVFDDKIEFKKKMNPFEVTRQLITFNDDEVGKLMLVGRQIRLFYFFKVHEIIYLSSLAKVDDINNDKDRCVLLYEFNQLLKKLGDFDIYSQFFVSDITLDSLDVLMTNKIDICDIVKIIINYSHLSIYNESDFTLIFNKIISTSF
jgi:hypothetical protein